MQSSNQYQEKKKSQSHSIGNRIKQNDEKKRGKQAVENTTKLYGVYDVECGTKYARKKKTNLKKVSDTCIFKCTAKFVYRQAHERVHTCTHIYTYIHIYTIYTHIYIYVYAYIYVNYGKSCFEGAEG